MNTTFDQTASSSPWGDDLKDLPLGRVASVFLERVPIAFARRHLVLGLESDNGLLPVAVASNENLSALDKLSVLLGVPTRPVLVGADQLRQAIQDAYGQQDAPVDAVLEGIVDSQADVALLETLERGGDLLDTNIAAPVTKLVNMVLFEAVKRRASDVHVQPLEDQLQIRLRIDGVLYDHVQPPKHLLDEIVSRIKVMARMNIAEKRLAQDGRTTVKVGDKVIDLRISSLPTSHGERVVIRLLDKSARLYQLTELGMGDADLEAFRRLIRQSHGIVLVTGPTGSGKTTTLYSALQELDHTALNILTLEDPIEYQLPGISQTQVSSKKGMTFATGLRHVLRQDPDVIMVGEVRDQETARMAIQSSLTGHLVFSTLHTNDAAGAVTRLLDLGIEPYLVAGSLLGVLAQRLVRCLCTHCRRARALTERDTALLGLSDHHVGHEVFDSVGCARCHDIGFHDRLGIFELLTVDEHIHDLITANPKGRLLKQTARRHGMTTLREDALGKLLTGTTTVDEVIRVTHADGQMVDAPTADGPLAGV